MNCKICCICKRNLLIENFHLNRSTKDGFHADCKSCRKQERMENKEKYRLKRIEKKKNFPWLFYYKNAKRRCLEKTHKDYKYYGEKGIKFLLSKEDVKNLWLRDSAYLLNKPSIDRADSEKNYILSNCRFIELSENITRSNNYRWSKK